MAVKVNKDEISVHQVNQQLARINPEGMSDDQKTEAQRTAVQRLVDQDLLLEQAKDKQLDRDPDVMTATENARRQILVDAYVQKQILPSAKPTDDEIHKYYGENPELFSSRRVYALQEAIVGAMTPEQLDQLKHRLSESKNLDEAVKWVTSQGVKVSVNVGLRPAEQLPMKVLKGVFNLKDGGVGIFEGPNRTADVIKVVSSQVAPIDEKAARASIEQFLTNRRREELVRDEVKRLRQSARIEYVGDFQKLAMQTDRAAPTAGASPAEAADSKAGNATAKGVKGL